MAVKVSPFLMYILRRFCFVCEIVCPELDRNSTDFGCVNCVRNQMHLNYGSSAMVYKKLISQFLGEHA